MKIALTTITATLIATSAAFADNALFDVNDAPINYEAQFVQALDFEPTASSDFVPAGELDPDYDPVNYDKLFD